MPSRSLWSRIRKGRLVQVLLVYLGVSWIVLQVVGELRDSLRLPDWIGPLALILLLIGLVVILATAWVQSHPLVDAREQSDEVPGSWELDVRDAVGSVKRGRVPHLTWARALLGGAAAFLLLFGGAGLYVVLTDRGLDLSPTEAVAGEAPDGIAVLPFTVRGAALEDWREGMVDLLSTGLDGAGGLRAISSRTVLARWSERIPDPSRADERTVLDVARGTGARYALLGSAVAIGPNVRLVADVRSLGDGRHLGQAQVEGPPDRVLTMVDQLAMQTLALILRRDEGDLPEVNLASLTTGSLPALKAYLEGETRFRRGDFAGATEAYERAVAEDSLFALAYHKLGQAYGWGESIASQRAADARERALALVDRLPDREATVVRGAAFTPVFLAEGIPILREAVRKYPDDAEAWYQLGDAYLHVRATLGGWDEAEPAFRRAVQLAPRFAPYRIHLIELAFRSRGDSALIVRELEEYEQLAPQSPTAHRYRLALDLAFGDSAARASTLEQVGERAAPYQRQMSFAISNPRFAETNERLIRNALAGAPRDQQAGARNALVHLSVDMRGKVNRGLAELAHPSMEDSQRRAWRYGIGSMFGLGGDSELDGLMSKLDVAHAASWDLMFFGAWAVDRGSWSDHAAATARLAALGDSALATGDTLEAQRMHARRRSLDGYALWKRGRADEAARVLEAEGDLNQHLVRWWLATLHHVAGRLREAEPYYRTFLTWDPEPFASYQLGLIYDRLGERDRARERLEFFVTNWADADPELRHYVADARQRLTRLPADRPR